MAKPKIFLQCIKMKFFSLAGLGYYQRARNLFKAKEYLKKNKLFISSSYLKQIPGIGDYISCSISAILKNENCAVVDGNIKESLSVFLI